MGRVLTPLLLGLIWLLQRCRNHLKHGVLNCGCYTNAYETIKCSSMMQLLHIKLKCLAYCPHPSGGPSVVKLCRPTRPNYLTGQFLYWLANCPLTLSGLSAIHPRQTSRDNDASGKILNSTADRPAPLGGPSAVHSANSPETTTSLDKILDSMADCPALLGGLSAVHPCEPHQTISSLDKLRSLRRTVRSPIADRPLYNLRNHQRQHCLWTTSNLTSRLSAPT